jgi:hypothetical protein
MTYWVLRLEGEHPSDNRYLAVQNLATSASKIGFREINYILYDGLANNSTRRSQIIEGLFSQVKPGDIVLFPFPLYILAMNFQKESIDYLKKKTNVKLIAFVLDLHTWLYKGDYNPKTDFLLEQLRTFNLLIVPTKKFAGRLKKEDVSTPMLSFDFLDFIYEGPLKTKSWKQKVYIASGRTIALKNYQGKSEIVVIGSSSSTRKNVTVLPHRKANELPQIFDGGFGAVDLINNVTTNTNNYDWDGYSAYTSPSKLSLYLASGLPVLVRSDSAVKSLVESKGIGLVVNDLNDVDQLFEKMTEKDYQKMLKKVAQYQRAVSKGFFAQRALLEGLAFLTLGIKDSII